jgi:hypothetical protein
MFAVLTWYIDEKNIKHVVFTGLSKIFPTYGSYLDTIKLALLCNSNDMKTLDMSRFLGH